MTKVVILLGAGATLSDVATNPHRSRPPLDKRFFSEARLTEPDRVATIHDYMRKTYATDVLDPAHDSLEGVMAQVYTDLFNPRLEVTAGHTFRELMRLFNGRLATTTNEIHPTNKRFLYRIVARYLAEGVRPSEITIITFNQDLQVEKCLHLMSTVSRWSHHADRIFSFPGLYSLGLPSANVTSPSEASEQVFPASDPKDDCISLLKLHGSLNWYSSHSSRAPSTSAMFKPSRKLWVTCRRSIEPRMTLQGKQRSMYTLPVIVPPVSHKSAVLHDSMKTLWRRAETRLRNADEIVVFGYSCPALDFESSNQLRRSQINRPHKPAISLIDPDPTTVARYIGLLGATRLGYYASAHDFVSR